MSTFSFTGHATLVTGAGSGIGRAVALRFAEEGASVLILDRDEDKGRVVAEEITTAGGTCEFVRVELMDEQQIVAALAPIRERFKRLDHVVNNAGMVMVKSIDACTAEDWDHVFNVNVRSVFLVVKHALTALRASPCASIVNVSSVSGLVAQTGTPAYVASKGAVLMLSKALALDLAPDGIRVNCVCPGITDTPMFHSHVNSTSDPVRTLQQRCRRVPLKRMLSPFEIADAILYLSSDRASGITGTELVVDGGYLATAEGPVD